MFSNHKKDPLVDSVKAIMTKTSTERQAVEKVNEVWGIQSRKQLPHEYYEKYDRAVKEAQKIALTEGIERLDQIEEDRKADLKSRIKRADKEIKHTKNPSVSGELYRKLHSKANPPKGTWDKRQSGWEKVKKLSQGELDNSKKQLSMKLSQEETEISEERKASSAIVKAFMAKKKAKAGKNSHTDGQALYLHGNKIAHHGEDGSVHATLAGWPTVTTRERLNSLSNAVGGQKFYQKKGKHYYGDKEIDSKETVKLKEDQLNELSKKVLASYVKKAASEVGHYGKKEGYKLSDRQYNTNSPESGKDWRRDSGAADAARKVKSKRLRGIDMATDKLTKEEALNELSKKVLASYVKKATTSAANIGRSIGYDNGVIQGTGGSDKVQDNAARKKRWEKNDDKGHKRIAGIEKAADRLSGEYKPKSMKYNANEDTQPATMLTVIQEEIRQYLMKEIDAMSESKRDDYIASLNEEQRAILFMNEMGDDPSSSISTKKDTSTSTATNAPPPPLMPNAGSVTPSTPVSVAPPPLAAAVSGAGLSSLMNRAQAPAAPAPVSTINPMAPPRLSPAQMVPRNTVAAPPSSTTPVSPTPPVRAAPTAMAPMAPKAPMSTASGTVAPMIPMPPKTTVSSVAPTTPAKQISTVAPSPTAAKPTVAKPAVAKPAAARKPMQPNRTPRSGSPAQSSQGPLRSGIPSWAAKAFNPDTGG